MSRNDITGDEIKSKILSKQGEDNWDRIFGKKDILCNVCGNYLKDVLDCNKNSCPKNEET
jgi:hypothetical protein